jgi:NAD/NADP transhydrogenase alpha subunit
VTKDDLGHLSPRFGGFLVTSRMLAMYKKNDAKK